MVARVLGGSRLIPVLALLYAALVILASIRLQISLTPDRVVILLLLLGLSTGRARLFLKDWSLFLVVLLAWQVLSGMSRNLGHLRPHVTEMIVVDRFLFFGHVPTVWLQAHLYHPGHLAFYDIGATLLYMLHFMFPICAAFALWMWKRPIFLRFMQAFVVLAFAGFSTYVLFPAAPPWIAGLWHYLPPVHRIFHDGVLFFGGPQSYGPVYQFLWTHGGWDVFGAVPSEHAAFPFLCFLYIRKAWPRGGWLVLPYCVAVWFAVVYLGEHYVADVLAGVLYATGAYLAIEKALPYLSVRLRPAAERAPIPTA